MVYPDWACQNDSYEAPSTNPLLFTALKVCTGSKRVQFSVLVSVSTSLHRSTGLELVLIILSLSLVSCGNHLLLYESLDLLALVSSLPILFVAHISFKLFLKEYYRGGWEHFAVRYLGTALCYYYNQTDCCCRYSITTKQGCLHFLSWTSSF